MIRGDGVVDAVRPVGACLGVGESRLGVIDRLQRIRARRLGERDFDGLFELVAVPTQGGTGRLPLQVAANFGHLVQPHHSAALQASDRQRPQILQAAKAAVQPRRGAKLVAFDLAPGHVAVGGLNPVADFGGRNPQRGQPLGPQLNLDDLLPQSADAHLIDALDALEFVLQIFGRAAEHGGVDIAR